jgi:hypothetical protein
MTVLRRMCIWIRKRQEQVLVYITGEREPTTRLSELAVLGLVEGGQLGLILGQQQLPLVHLLAGQQVHVLLTVALTSPVK